MNPADLEQLKRSTGGGDAVLDVVIIGTGFSGLGMAIKLKEAGIHSFQILEKAADVGGTWRDNHYPGCACDVQSHLYSFSFEPNPDWTRMFAPQPEIWAYLRGCADRYGLRPQIRFHCELVSARWDDAAAHWLLRGSDGYECRARALVSGMGALSRPAYPRLPGLETFQGKTFHSQDWDHAYPLEGKRVAVIGTGASAIQFVPKIAGKVARLDLYQRTPPWIIPKPDREISGFERRLFRRLPFLQRLFRGAIYCMLETRVLGFVISPKLMQLVQRAALGHIRRQVADPALRAKLTPDYTIGCKRILISDDYYPALTRPNVEVIATGVAEVRAHSVVTTDGVEREVDAIIFGTGFQTTQPVPRGVIHGRGGLELLQAWEQGVEAYLGTTVAGFPNLYLLMGPNTGLGHTSMVYMIESQIAHVMQAVKVLREGGVQALEPRADLQRRYNDDLQARLGHAVWNAGGCRSWYLDERGRNFSLWPGFTFRFRQLVRRFRREDFVEVKAAQKTGAAA